MQLKIPKDTFKQNYVLNERFDEIENKIICGPSKCIIYYIYNCQSKKLQKKRFHNNIFLTLLQKQVHVMHWSKYIEYTKISQTKYV